jgi:hypothetical protein
LLHSLFLVLSLRAGDHWSLDEEEATQLSKAIANVARHYPVAKTQRAADWAQLMLVVGVLGVPRTVESLRLQKARAPARAPAPAPAREAASGVGHNGGPPLGTMGGGVVISQPGLPPVVVSGPTPAMSDADAMAGSHNTIGSA